MCLFCGCLAVYFHMFIVFKPYACVLSIMFGVLTSLKEKWMTGSKCIYSCVCICIHSVHNGRSCMLSGSLFHISTLFVQDRDIQCVEDWLKIHGPQTFCGVFIFNINTFNSHLLSFYFFLPEVQRRYQSLDTVNWLLDY